jgi:hypothetical protein
MIYLATGLHFGMSLTKKKKSDLGPEYEDVNRTEVAQNIVQLRGTTFIALQNFLISWVTEPLFFFLKKRPVARFSYEL